MKPRPNHRLYITILRQMGPERRLRKAFELSEFSRALFRQGLEHSHPEIKGEALNQFYMDRMRKSQSRVD